RLHKYSNLSSEPEKEPGTMFNGLSIRRQSKNFCKNMLMGYYPGEKKKPPFMFHRNPFIFH
ncbi:hypothetical protein AALU65_07065, partial [Akkermansia muciniphila]|uniref:hypothetical protein n=1 Tax=Akkermansia muciniphila TaxID=239935 RepID=UPI003518B7B3